MYVKAPYRNLLGTTNQNVTLRSLSGAAYNTAAEAKAVASGGYYNATLTSVQGQTTKSIMQRGIVGPNQFVDTDYFASYIEYRSSGLGWTVVRNTNTGKFEGNNAPLAYGYTGFNGSGIAASNLGMISPTASGGALTTYNRAVIANLQNRIKTELMAKVVGQGLDLGEAFSGLPQAIKLVAERVIQVVSAWNAVRSRNFRKAADVLGLRRRWTGKHSADVWLEMQYGWLPLLTDIFDASNEVIDLFDSSNDKDFFTVTRRGQAPLVMTPDSPSPIQWQSVKQTASATVMVESKIRYTVADDFVAYMSKLRVNNPGYIAWAALPYSFVLDWLVPIGDMLAASGAHIGLNFKGGYQTTVTYGGMAATASGWRQQIAWPLVDSGGSANASAKALYMQRTGFFTFPMPAPYVKWPFGSFERAASAVSLIATSRKRAVM